MTIQDITLMICFSLIYDIHGQLDVKYQNQTISQKLTIHLCSSSSSSLSLSYRVIQNSVILQSRRSYRLHTIRILSCNCKIKKRSCQPFVCVKKKKKERWQSTLFQTPPSRPPHPNPRPTSGRKASDQFTSRHLASSSGHDTVYTHNFNYLQLKKDKHILQKGKNIFHLRIF